MPEPAEPRLLRALVVDDEAPAREELAWLLQQDPRVASVSTAAGGTQALRLLETEPFDVVFCDIKMPGLDGLDLARVFARFAERPAVVFVTAYEDHAVDAFDLRAADYVVKPVRPDRLAEAVRRVAEPHPPAASAPAVPTQTEEMIPVDLGGVTRFVPRSRVRWVEAQGDYARLHTDDGTHLVRVALTMLEQRWSAAGFVRIHRSTLVALPYVEELRVEGGRCSVRVGGTTLPVSRRHARDLRDLLVRASSVRADRLSSRAEQG